jgi:DNA-binding IclR family transcriptional regulator
MPYQRKQDTPSSIFGRFLLILGAFTTNAPLTLSEISRHTGLPTSTTRRLLNQMTECDALVRTEDRQYRIGPRLAELPHLVK